MKHKTRTKALSWLLSLALMLGLLPGMSLPAQAAASPKVTLDFTDYGWGIPTGETTGPNTYTRGTYSIELYGTTHYKQNSGYLILGKANSYLKLPAFDFDVGKIVVTGTKQGGSDSVNFNIYVGDTEVSTAATGTRGTKTFEIASGYQAAGNAYTLRVTSAHNVQITKIEIYEKESNIAVTGVTLDPSAAQAISVGDTVSFTATISPTGPNGATDRTVIWSVNNSNVKLYSDSNCTTEVGADATSALTVYAKGMAVGAATVTVTSNADNTKTANCAVTVNTPSTYNAYTVKSSDTSDTLPNKVVRFNGMDWYIIEDNSTAANAGSVTLLAKDSVGSSKFNENEADGNKYSTSTVKAYVDSLTAEGGSFAGVADAIKTVSFTIHGYNSSEIHDTVTNVKLFLLNASEAKALPQDVRYTGNYWWLLSPGNYDSKAACVNKSGDVNTDGSSVMTYSDDIRPALQLDLSKVTFNSETKAFTYTPHTHSFNYTENGATITATCANTDGNCPLDDGTDAHNHTATLTIKPPANLVYDGKAKAATVENNINSDELTITYKKGNDTVDAANVIGKGAYTASVTFGGQTASVNFTITDPTYTITIPAKLTVANAGWNATAGITASGAIAEGTKLTVTAESANEWAMVKGEDKIFYKLAASGDSTTTYANATEKTAWEFTDEELAAENGTTKTMGAVVDDYINAPQGDYADTVTFKASVGNPVVTISYQNDPNNQLKINYTTGQKWSDVLPTTGSANGVTYYDQSQLTAWAADADLGNMQLLPGYYSGQNCLMAKSSTTERAVAPDDVINSSYTYVFKFNAAS